MKKNVLGVVVVMLVAAMAICVFGCTSNEKSESPYVTEGTLTLMTSPDYPPYENLVDGEYVGFEIDLGEAIAKEMGLKCVWVSENFDSIISAIQAGGKADAGVADIGIDEDRKKLVDFTDEYLSDAMSVCVVTESGLKEADINQSDMTIAVQSGTTCADYAKENFPKAKIIEYTNATDCYAAMQAGYAKGEKWSVCANTSVVKGNLENFNASIIMTSDTGEGYAMVVSKDHPEITEAINKAIKTLKDNGTIDKLAAKWEL